MNEFAYASVSFNGDFFDVVTMSMGGVLYGEPSRPYIYLPPDASDAELGQAVLEAMSYCKKGTLFDFNALHKSGVLKQKGEEAEAYAMKQYGYKTRRLMYKNMHNCNVSIKDGNFMISPTHHKSIDGYSANNIKGPFPLTIPLKSTPAQLGAALREGFTRCTSSYK